MLDTPFVMREGQYLFPEKLYFRQGFTTLALIGGEGLYCAYYPLPTAG